MLIRWLLFALLLMAGPLRGADLAREGRIAADIRAALQPGQPVTLKAGGNDFFAIATQETSSYSRGAVVLLHGRGAHPDWPEVIHPLRSRLPDHGWKTLSIQLPIAASDASDWVYPELIPEALPRITAAVERLQQQGVNDIVLIGHSLGARMGLEFLARGVPDGVQAFVAIGLAADTGVPDGGVLDALKKLDLPLLDLYGSRDTDAVLQSAPARGRVARLAGNRAYRQRRVEGADHFFTGLDDTLVAEVRAWLGRVMPVGKTQ